MFNPFKKKEKPINNHAIVDIMARLTVGMLELQKQVNSLKGKAKSLNDEPEEGIDATLLGFMFGDEERGFTASRGIVEADSCTACHSELEGEFYTQITKDGIIGVFCKDCVSVKKSHLD